MFYIAYCKINTFVFVNQSLLFNERNVSLHTPQRINYQHHTNNKNNFSKIIFLFQKLFLNFERIQLQQFFKQVFF